MITVRKYATVVTVVEPEMRSRVTAATGGCFSALHAATVTDVIRAVREKPVSAILISPEYVVQRQLGGVASLIRGFPSIPTVALVSSHSAASSEGLLKLGLTGVKHMVDVTARDGWGNLRNILVDPVSPATAVILGRVLPQLEDATEDFTYFFEVLVTLSPDLTTVRSLCRRLAVRPSTFMSRFFRAGLPSPKRFLSAVRALHAAALLEDSGLSIADVAYRLDYSSPQSFSRHLKALKGVTAGKFRRTCNLSAEIDVFIDNFVAPFRSRFRAFHPLETGVMLGRN